MNHEEVKREVDLMTERLPVGATQRLRCPACGENTLSASRTEANVVAYTCHRDSCDTRGYIGRVGHRRPVDLPKEQVVYTGTCEPLTTQDELYFWDRFKLMSQATSNISRNSEGQYVFQVRGPVGALRGHVVRRGAWSGGEPLVCPLPKVLPKVKSYRLYPDGAFSAWYHPMGNVIQRHVVIVEDCVSALCAAQVGFHSVALLGTHMSNEIARELQVFGWPVILALDPDATETSLKIAQKWGPALPTTRVLILNDDLKDDISQLEAIRV